MRSIFAAIVFAASAFAFVAPATAQSHCTSHYDYFGNYITDCY